MNIMLVDKNTQALLRAAKRLASRPLALTLFLYTDGRDALKFAIYNSTDIVYARQTLPGMTGAEMAGHIRRFHPDMRFYTLGDGEESLVSIEKAA